MPIVRNEVLDEIEERDDAPVEALRFDSDIENREDKRSINREISNEEKDLIETVVTKRLENILWNKIFYTSTFQTISISTQSSELFPLNGRAPDTSRGQQFKIDRPARFRTAFYLNQGWNTSTVYICAPGIQTGEIGGDTIRAEFRAFTGIKIVNGAVFIVSFNRGVEKLTDTDVVITDNRTHILEIEYGVNHSTVFFDGRMIGGVSLDLVGFGRFDTFFSFLTSVGSNNGETANLTMESHEFLQPRAL